MKLDSFESLEFRDQLFTLAGQQITYDAVTSIRFKATVTQHSINGISPSAYPAAP